MRLTDYLADWDPMDFISDLDAPRDEYSIESAEIKLKYKSAMTSMEVASIVYQVFNDRIGVEDSHGFKEECIDHGPDILNILREENQIERRTQSH